MNQVEWFQALQFQYYKRCHANTNKRFWVTFYMRSNHLHQVVDKTLAPSMFFSVKTKIRNTTILILLHSYLYNYNQGQYFPFKYFQTYPFQKLFSTYSGSWINTQFHFWNFFVNFFHEVNHKINKFMAIHLFGMEIGNQEANVVSLEYNSHHITFFCWGVYMNNRWIIIFMY